MGIFGGARLRGWWPFLLPLAVLLASDLALWGLTGGDPRYSPLHLSRLYVYTSFLIYVLIGKLLVNCHSLWIVAGAGVLGGLQFFLVTNFGVWLFQPLMDPALLSPQYTYSRDLAGLMNCYIAALPFYQDESIYTLHNFLILGHPSFLFFGTILGDVVFSLALFGIYDAVAQNVSAAQAAQLESSTR
jgi:hypothetical protein